MKAKGRLLWRLINNTPGVADLASHLEKETPFDKLPRDEQITALAIVSHYEEGARVIEEEAAKRWNGEGKSAPAEAAPVAPIPVDDPAETERVRNEEATDEVRADEAAEASAAVAEEERPAPDTAA